MGVGVGVGEEVGAFDTSPRATMTLLLLGTMILPGSMGTFGWPCEVSLLPAAV